MYTLTADSTVKNVKVKLDRSRQSKKPFLGGYRNREAGTVFHNASVQTIPKTRPETGIQKNSRETQVKCFHFQMLFL